MFQSKRQKTTAWIVFGLYLILLTWLVLFKFSTNLAELPQHRHINLIPFAESAMRNGSVYLSEIVYNVLAFVPLGVYLGIFLPELSFAKRLLLGLCLSLGYETLQYVFGIGASDITDVINNTLGTMLGMLCLCGFKRLSEDRVVTVVNAIGLTAELCWTVLFVLLIIANP